MWIESYVVLKMISVYGVYISTCIDVLCLMIGICTGTKSHDLKLTAKMFIVYLIPIFNLSLLSTKDANTLNLMAKHCYDILKAFVSADQKW